MENFDFIANFKTPTILLDKSSQILKSNNLFQTQSQLAACVVNNKIKFDTKGDESNWKAAVDLCLANGFSEVELKNLKQKVYLSCVEMGPAVIAAHFVDASAKVSYQLPQEHPFQKEFTEIGSSVAHAINNPLTVIKTRTQMLKFLYDAKKPVTEEMVLQLLEKVESQADRIKNVVEILRSLVKFPPAEEYLDVNVFSILSDVQMALAEQFKEKNITYELKSTVKEKWIHCKPEELAETFKALLMNAIEAFTVAATASPKIEVTFEEDDQNLRFYFNDNGPGINSENYPKIFKPFFTTKTHNAATVGVGLSVGRKYAKSYGGSLTNVDASPGHCSFLLSLPKVHVAVSPNSGQESLKKTS